MKKILFTLFVLAFSTQLIVAQNLRRANRLFEKRAYVDAAELYLNEEFKTQEVHEKLGDCYYFNNKMNEAAQWYKLLVKRYEDKVDPTYYYRYSQALKGINNFDEADKWLQKYLEKKQIVSSDNNQTLVYFDALNKEIKRPYIIHPMDLNSKQSDFGVATLGNKLVFASSRNEGKLYDWNHQPYLDLFQATIDTTFKVTNINPFSDNINTIMHESNAVFTADGKTMYFNRNNFIKGQKKKDKNQVSQLKIYKAQLVNNEWTKVIELPFNSDNYSVEHPALSTDEKKLYFASDMPGSVGSFDLYSVDINSNGTYGKPENLGPIINTEQREQFPFMSSKNILYYASDGHVGLGGLDVFKSEFKNGTFSTPINLSDVINSSSDDFSFIIDEDSETGYFSSNRKGGKGDDDIYRFTQTKKTLVEGLILNKNNSGLLAGAIVSLFDADNNTIADIIVGDNASYSFEIENNKTYKIRGTQKLYNTSEIEITPNTQGIIYNRNILLEEAPVTIVADVTQTKFNPIYFDFNKWNIRMDATSDLDTLLSFMKKNPELIVEIGAHTDCRGTEQYNLGLSHKRAKSVKQYLISNGIPKLNLKSVDFGETKPVNQCVTDEVCTEEEHALNRRCEFIILK